MARVGATKSNNSRRQRAVKRPAAARSKSVQSVASVAPPVATPARAPRDKFPNSWQLLVKTYEFWRTHARILSVYLLVVAALSLLLVHNFGADASALKTNLAQLLGNDAPANNLATYAVFIGSSTGSAQGAAAVYQYILLIVVSLSMIWLLRQLLSDKPPLQLRVRDAFYQGMYPLVPFALVMMVLALELIPFLLATFLYATVVQNGIAIGLLQHIIWLIVLLAGTVVSVWLLATYYFAVYIATLPNMTPVLALRNAKQLSRGQRPNIIRKSLLLLLACVLVSLVVLLPVIAVVPVLTGLFFFILGVLALPFVHSYLYVMYRELLRD